MIPLAKWLQEDDPPALEVISGPSFASDADPAASERHQAEIEEAYQRGFSDGAAERDVVHAETLAAQEAASSVREAAIVAEWSVRFSGQIVEGIETSFLAMRRDIETALEKALSVFLEDEVRRKLSTSLLQVIENETSGAGRLPLEVSAPEELHDHIRSQCESRGLTLSLTHSSEIKVIFRDGLLRFDDMSKHWSEMIKGAAS